MLTTLMTGMPDLGPTAAFVAHWGGNIIAAGPIAFKLANQINRLRP